MDIADRPKYRKYREANGTWDSTNAFIVNLALPMLLFGSVGAITWAIRGTGGWGGIDGTVVPGMTWALLWYYLCYRKGIDSRSIVFWLGLGIAIGGELGYGQYVSWIMGRFTVGKEIEVMGKTTGVTIMPPEGKDTCGLSLPVHRGPLPEVSSWGGRSKGKRPLGTGASGSWYRWPLPSSAGCWSGNFPHCFSLTTAPNSIPK